MQGACQLTQLHIYSELRSVLDMTDFWSRLQLGSLHSCHILLSFLDFGNLLDKNLMLPVYSHFFCQKGTCAKLGEYLPDATEEPIYLDPEVAQSCSSVLKQLVFFHN